jgi:hypothetical protein
MPRHLKEVLKMEDSKIRYLVNIITLKISLFGIMTFTNSGRISNKKWPSFSSPTVYYSNKYFCYMKASYSPYCRVREADS